MYNDDESCNDNYCNDDESCNDNYCNDDDDVRDDDKMLTASQSNYGGYIKVDNELSANLSDEMTEGQLLKAFLEWDERHGQMKSQMKK